MDLQRQDYPAMLTSLSPPVAARLFNDRLRSISALNTGIADWLQERRRIEETYAQSLRKLAARQLLDDASELGIFSTPWQKVVASVDALAASHHGLAANIETDVEGPIRDFNTSNREMSAMKNMSGNIEAIAKEVENAQRRAGKLQEKGGKAAADKVASAASDMETAQGQWESQAPFFYERLQEADELRLETIRNALTQYTTYAIESQNSGTSASEDCLNSLLNVQTIDEIKTFAMKYTSAAARVSNARASTSRAGPPSRAGTMGSTAPVSGIGNPPMLTPTISRPEDSSSLRAKSIQEKPEKPEKSKLSGLKRLGTVLGRRRQSTHPYGQPLSPEPEVKKSSSNLNSSLNPLKKRSKDNRLSEIPDLGERRISEQSFEPPRSSSGPAPPPLERNLSNRQNGDVDAIEPVNPPTTLTNGSAAGYSGGLLQPLQPTRANQVTPQVDEQGFSAPPSGLDAISQAEQDSAFGSMEGSQNPLRVDIRNAPIAEEDGDASAAMASVSSALRAQQLAGPKRSMGTVRGRRDRNTMLVTNPSEQLPNLARSETGGSASSTPQAVTDTGSTFPLPAPGRRDDFASVFPEPAPAAGNSTSTAFPNVAPSTTFGSSSSFPEPVPAANISRDGQFPQMTAQDAFSPTSDIISPTTGSSFSATSPTSQQSVASPVAFTTPAPPLPTIPAAAPLELSREADPPFHQSPFKMSTRSTLGLGDDHVGSDTHSIRSGRSLSSTGSNAAKHPDLLGPGLNTSIIETVNAWFGADSTVARAVVVGELALAYNPSDVSTPFGHDTIRLENFGTLEKVAPNPAFIDPLTAGANTEARTQPGSYSVSLRDIVSKTVIAFKYQLRLQPSDYDRHTPLRIHASWKIEDTQSSVVLQYGLHPGFAASLPADTTSIQLHNTVIVLNIDTGAGRATNAKAMGGGIFSRERNLVYWRLGDISLSRDAPSTTLRARFFTEGPAKAGAVEARWEYTPALGASGQDAGLHVSVLDRTAKAPAPKDEYDPFADDQDMSSSMASVAESSWKPVAAVKKLRSGTYTTEAK